MDGQKRGFVDVGERSELGHKRVKMKDLQTVFSSEDKGNDNHYTKYWMNRHAADVSCPNKETVAVNPDLTQSVEMKNDTSQPVECSAYIALDLNAKVHITSDGTRACADKADNQNSNSKLGIDKSRGFGFDLNVEDDSSSDLICPNKNIEPLKVREDLECESMCSPMVEKDPMKVWKEMKQNGFMSSSHGGVLVAKPRGRKSKADGLKKKMEIAKREQVDRFAKIAAPSGLLNGLNPGIINHVRNSKQVYSIIDALVRSERRDNVHSENKEEKIQMKTERIESTVARDRGNLNLSGMKSNNHCHEDGSLHNASRIKQTSDCLISSENIRGTNDSSMVENSISDQTNCLSYFNVENQDIKLALKDSSSVTMASQNISTLCDEDSTDFLSVSSLSFKAANVASQWLELLQQDIKGRLGALRRSKKRVRVVSREFSHNQENVPYVTRIPVSNSSANATADMHKARWSALFNQMEKALSEEERRLENWLEQVKEMQCDCGLSQFNGAPGSQQLGTLKIDCRIENPKDSERVLAVRAAAAALYSTCNFSQSVENSPCF